MCSFSTVNQYHLFQNGHLLIGNFQLCMTLSFSEVLIGFLKPKSYLLLKKSCKRFCISFPDMLQLTYSFTPFSTYPPSLTPYNNLLLNIIWHLIWEKAQTNRLQTTKKISLSVIIVPFANFYNGKKYKGSNGTASSLKSNYLVM